MEYVSFKIPMGSKAQETHKKVKGNWLCKAELMVETVCSGLISLAVNIYIHTYILYVYILYYILVHIDRRQEPKAETMEEHCLLACWLILS